MLQKSYPEDFERVWKEYPKWPTGRSKKEPSYKTFAKQKKILQFTGQDIDDILADIEERKHQCETWQIGNKFGPVMFGTYFNQHLWNEPYKKPTTKFEARKVTVAEEVDNDLKAWQQLYKYGTPLSDIPAQHHAKLLSDEEKLKGQLGIH